MQRHLLLSFGMLALLAQPSWSEQTSRLTAMSEAPPLELQSVPVKQALGLSQCADSIAAALEGAKDNKKLTNIEIREYLRRLEDLKGAIATSKGASFNELQTIARSAADLADAVNGKLAPPPTVPEPDEQLVANEYKQVRTMISERVRAGIFDLEQAKRMRISAQKIYNRGIASKQPEALAIASQELRKLEGRVHAQTAHRVRQHQASLYNSPGVL